MRGSGGLLLLARAVRIIAGLLAAVIVLGILFVLLEGNRRNGIVSTVLSAAQTLVGPFDQLFTPRDPKGKVAVNWGIAAAVYVLVGALIAAALRRAATLGGRSNDDDDVGDGGGRRRGGARRTED